MVNDMFVQKETNYESAQTDLLRALSEFDVSLSRKSAHSSEQADEDELDSYPRPAKLPKWDLPTLSGRYEDWEDFCDLFTSLVHDALRLVNVAKLQYLKSCLTGAAADLVKEVATTNANYLSTWQALKVDWSVCPNSGTLSSFLSRGLMHLVWLLLKPKPIERQGTIQNLNSNLPSILKGHFIRALFRMREKQK